MGRKRSKVVELLSSFDRRKAAVQKEADGIKLKLGTCKYCGSSDLKAEVSEIYVEVGPRFRIEVSPAEYDPEGEPAKLKPAVYCEECKQWLTD